MSEKVFCTACGAENEKGGKFCVNCGNQLDLPVMGESQETTVENTVAEEQSHATYSQQADTYYYSEPQQTKTGGYQGVAIASLVCGILAVLCCPLACCGCCFRVLEWLLAIAAIVTGIITLVKAFAGKGMAIAGIVCGGIALAGLIFGLIVSSVTGSAAYDIYSDVLGNEFMEDFEDLFEDAMYDSGYYY